MEYIAGVDIAKTCKDFSVILVLKNTKGIFTVADSVVIYPQEDLLIVRDLYERELAKLREKYRNLTIIEEKN